MPRIYDVPEDEGIRLEFDIADGLTMGIFMTDEAAQDMVEIIQNKLNARI